MGQATLMGGMRQLDFRAHVEGKYSKLGLRVLRSFKNPTVFIAQVSTHELTSMLKSTVKIKIQKQRKQDFGGSMTKWRFLNSIKEEIRVVSSKYF